MNDQPENHTIKLLQELRKEVRDGFEHVSTRIDGLTHIITLLAGHNHSLESRVSTLEDILKTK